LRRPAADSREKPRACRGKPDRRPASDRIRDTVQGLPRRIAPRRRRSACRRSTMPARISDQSSHPRRHLPRRRSIDTGRARRRRFVGIALGCNARVARYPNGGRRPRASARNCVRGVPPRDCSDAACGEHARRRHLVGLRPCPHVRGGRRGCYDRSRRPPAEAAAMAPSSPSRRGHCKKVTAVYGRGERVANSAAGCVG
jgi:hypothetical protein